MNRSTSRNRSFREFTEYAPPEERERDNLLQDGSSLHYGTLGYYSEDNDYGNKSVDRAYSADEYEATLPRVRKSKNMLQKTGRQRRKMVARGTTSTPLSKRKISVFPVAMSIKIDELYENLEGAQYREWHRSLHGDEVIRLFKTGKPSSPNQTSVSTMSNHSHDHNNIGSGTPEGIDDGIWSGFEVFIFEFGIAVFWGFPANSHVENTLLGTIKKYADVVLDEKEIEDGEDDMAFRLDESLEKARIANDIINLNIDSAQQRLAVSYAIAQSAVLSIFESRVEKMMDKQKWIPESLAKTGTVHVPATSLGKMIGEVFVIRHDVNLHSDILDFPDYFWSDDRFENEYISTKQYLEIDGRVNVLNTRVDMMRELLQVLQAQAENEHGTNLELIVIWLIVAEVVLQLIGMSIGYLTI